MTIDLNRRVLVEHIARNNLSQREFARKAGLSSGYVAQLLAGKRKPSPRLRERLMTATGLEFDALFQIQFTEDAVNV